jgi:Zn finger protein HypA/HybF involved in hydrogenase expression
LTFPSITAKFAQETKITFSMEKNDFLCPHCRGHLRPNNKIILSARTPDNKVGLILLSPELGEYSVVKHDSFKLKEGEHINIFCPVCHADLGAYHENKNLAKIIMIDEKGIESDIVFSEIAGQKSTCKIHGDQIEDFGEDASIYTNLWGATPKY